MKKISFICLGNICRSPMAEFIMKDLIKKANLQKEFFITSAGTSGEHDGESMHPGTKNKLLAFNIDHQGFISKKLTQKLCDESDFLITMDNSNFKNVQTNFNNTQNKLLKITDFTPDLAYNEVPDPWYSGNFDETYEILSLACKNLLAFLQK
ncbi:low molecular weight phosphotyrosine protein phosphatase [Campylobacter sp. VicNov18]|uniref:low molecular weight protein-tyrosine-phosphatase n=1 Tax=Campylobacter bilis TaxID=2691918 RepID=UPI00130EF0B0|nr:low molecular weight protein-tyrosine-phosphatase [Campylobacter bilis]MPV63126.1 low molecular weight phosphotyrosine protein phosphatase [Campylobacter hepaticus]MBM0636625.1 low molecular weight phosphotyrosine protein phosphatase [Campylobacter bilis]MCC8277470.1 low molecular weight phosphotyrosine protein phosphatase [Campylobacter bilis]MCC8298675.1 low molecular weight phosphotyrosine protein phosphatase [Campylobacter bilis]MCC8300379.1 low molecular weight phosphotyrosine protein 